jgi:hypothetical protein
MPLTHDFYHLSLNFPCVVANYSLLTLYSRISSVSMKTPTFVFLDFPAPTWKKSLSWFKKAQSFSSTNQSESAS